MTRYPLLDIPGLRASIRQSWADHIARIARHIPGGIPMPHDLDGIRRVVAREIGVTPDTVDAALAGADPVPPTRRSPMEHDRDA